MISAGAKQTLNTDAQLKDAAVGSKDEQDVSTEETETLINNVASSTDFEAVFREIMAQVKHAEAEADADIKRTLSNWYWPRVYPAHEGMSEVNG
ncbi:hypothetical protein N7467_002361 [Penicillium canescens]|nr:hypothetical protein N7467_002361 [Penicillium canescens]